MEFSIPKAHYIVLTQFGCSKPCRCDENTAIYVILSIITIVMSVLKNRRTSKANRIPSCGVYLPEPADRNAGVSVDPWKKSRMFAATRLCVKPICRGSNKIEQRLAKWPTPYRTVVYLLNYWPLNHPPCRSGKLRKCCRSLLCWYSGW